MRRYVISTKPRTWGAVVTVVAQFEPAGAAPEGARCYASLAGRTAPCEGCPVRASSFEKGDAVSILANDSRDMWVARAHRAARDTAEVTVYSLDDRVTSTVVREKLQRVARAAQLSARERTVLDLLLHGRRNDEIAAELKISVRTAKFHQANILKKLDVDSRLDLLRLLL
jgi:DNA-binding CsgD family transcriptional regulator